MESHNWRTGVADSPTTVVESTNFRGSGLLHFRYEGDVTKIYLWSGEALAYAGPPIPSFHLSSQELGLYFEWNGPGATVDISDRCSIRTLLRGFT